MNSRRIWTAAECSTTWLTGFPLGVVPPSLDSQIRVLSRGVEVGLEIGGIIGAVPLLNGDTLQVVPKVGPANFFRMLLTADGLDNRLNNDFDDFASWGDDGTLDTVPVLLARRFIKELAKIEADGARFGRVTERKARENPSGKIAIRQTVKRLRLHSATPFVSDKRVRDFDIPENRVLASAASVSTALMSQRGALEAWQSALAAKWCDEYLSPETLANDLTETARDLALGSYGGPRGNYVNAITLARLILGQAGMSQEGRTQIFGDALVVNGASLFEDYVRAVLSRFCNPLGLSVTKGGSPLQFLYEDGTFGLIPDIRIARGLTTLVLGDAKYKDPSSGDHYQMATYMQAYGVKRAFLLCPAYEVARSGLTRRQSQDGRMVMEVRLPLHDLDATEAILAGLYQALPFLTN